MRSKVAGCGRVPQAAEVVLPSDKGERGNRPGGSPSKVRKEAVAGGCQGCVWGAAAEEYGTVKQNLVGRHGPASGGL